MGQASEALLKLLIRCAAQLRRHEATTLLHVALKVVPSF